MTKTKTRIIAGAAIAAVMAVSICAFAACGGDKACTHTNISHVEATDPSEIEDGNMEYWYCADCGKYYSDADATTEISKDDTVLTYIVCIWDGSFGPADQSMTTHLNLYRDGTYYMEIVGMNNYGEGTWSYNDKDGLYVSATYLPLAGASLPVTVTANADGTFSLVSSMSYGDMSITVSMTGLQSDLQGLTITAGN